MMMEKVGHFRTILHRARQSVVSSMHMYSKRPPLGNTLDGTAFLLPGKTAFPKQDKTKADPLNGRMRTLRRVYLEFLLVLQVTSCSLT